MPAFRRFALDDWIYEYLPLSKEGTLHNSCVEPLSLAALQAFNSNVPILTPETALTYGVSPGLVELRENITSLYHKPDGTTAIEPSDVLITTGAISANHLVLDTIISASDHVIVAYPTYGQLQEIPRRLGASVSLWKQRPPHESGSWALDLAGLANLLTPTTKAIILNNPSNPTGYSLSRSDLEAIIELVRPHNTLLICDEVFRFMHHQVSNPASPPTSNSQSLSHPSSPPPSLLELSYPHTIVTASLSKAFALPGIRIGWIAASPHLRDNLLRRIADTREYTHIAVSQLDQRVAAFATRADVREKILARTREICWANLEVLGAWAQRNREWVEYTAPVGGGTAVIRILGKGGKGQGAKGKEGGGEEEREPVDDVAFAEAVTAREGILVPPAGRCFGYEADGSGGTDLKGCLRIGIVSGVDVLERGLQAIERVWETWEG